MDREKIDAVGQILGIELSDTKQWKRKTIGKIICGIIQGLIALGSILLGLNYGRAGPGYPFAYIPWNDFGQGSFFEAAIHTGNGLFLIPKEMRFGLSRSQRMKIFWGNLILSFALFVISFSVAWKIRSGVGTLYGVYDHHRK